MANPRIKIEDEDISSEDVSVDRMRRMKALVRTLYQEEIAPKRPFFKPIKAKGLIMAMSVLAALMLSASSLYSFNRFIDLNEKVLSSKGHVETTLQRRQNLFANLVNITLNQAAVEKEIFRHVASVRSDLNRTNELLSEISKNPDVASSLLPGGMAAQEPGVSVASSLSRLLAVVEQYPDIKSYSSYLQLMDKLVDIENRIADRRTEYNDNARVYNHAVSAFPWYILARATGFSRFEYFKASENVLEVPVLTPKTFERLLPDGNKK
ncbi:MAG: LemA family protein [Nitrospinota bacterium]